MSQLTQLPRQKQCLNSTKGTTQSPPANDAKTDPSSIIVDRRVFFNSPNLADRADPYRSPKEQDLPRFFGCLGANI